MRDAVIQFVQRWLGRRYNKRIVEILDPFKDMVTLLRPTRVRGIVDGGAYHGEISLRFCSLFPTAVVYAFEPASQSYSTLCKSVGHEPRIKPQDRALSSTSRIRTLFVNAQDSTNALSPVGDGGEKYQSWQTRAVGRESVRTVTLDGWARQYRPAPIDLLKLDLQGHELKALKGARKLLESEVKLIYTEVEFVRIYEENCLFFELEEFLRPIGFDLHRLYNLTHGEDGQLVCGDAIFLCRNRLQ